MLDIRQAIVMKNARPTIARYVMSRSLRRNDVEDIDPSNLQYRHTRLITSQPLMSPDLVTLGVVGLFGRSP